MLDDKEMAKALAIVEKKVKGIEAKAKGEVKGEVKASVLKAKKDKQKAEKAAARTAAKADKAAAKAREKSAKAAVKVKVREEEARSKRDAKEGKGKGKVAVNTEGEPVGKAIPKAKWQKKDNATSGDWEAITALYNDCLAAATAASITTAMSDGDKVNSEASGGRGKKEVGKGNVGGKTSINAPDTIVAISEAVGMDVDQAEKKKPKVIKPQELAASDCKGLPSM